MRDLLEIIAIGGSAGALEPLMHIVRSLPDAVTAPIVVVIHLVPRTPSLLPLLLQRETSRPVVEPEDKTPLAASTVYVAPPNYHMLVERNRTIALSVDEPVQYSRPSIDVLFESVARAAGIGAIAVLLSGSNSDGAEGLGLIAAAGGSVIVQSPTTAQFSEMPLAGQRRVPSALALDASDIPRHLRGTYRA